MLNLFVSKPTSDAEASISDQNESAALTSRFSLVGQRYASTILAVTLLLGCIIVVILGVGLIDFAVDDAYITLRHARNLVAGEGFSFNPGERLLSTTSPLHALLLALLTSVGFSDLPKVAVWLSVCAMLTMCGTVFYVLNRTSGPLAALACVMLLISQHWLYRFFALETILALALNMIAVTLALRRQWLLAGVVSGLSMICRPDSLMLAALIACYAILAEKFRLRGLLRYFIGGTLSYGPWLIFSIRYFGSPLPNTLSAKSGFENWTVFIGNMWPKIIGDLIPGYWQLSALLVLFAGVGCVRLVQMRSPLLIIPGWALLHMLGYTLLRIAYPFAWYYAPIILCVLLLAGLGIVETASYALASVAPRLRLGCASVAPRLRLLQPLLDSALLESWR